MPTDTTAVQGQKAMTAKTDNQSENTHKIYG
jgi:hypothetical protein